MSPSYKNVEKYRIPKPSSLQKSSEFNIFSENYDPYHKVKGLTDTDKNNTNTLKESNKTNAKSKNIDDYASDL
jgi:hypothetical protein